MVVNIEYALDTMANEIERVFSTVRLAHNLIISITVNEFTIDKLDTYSNVLRLNDASYADNLIKFLESDIAHGHEVLVEAEISDKQLHAIRKLAQEYYIKPKNGYDEEIDLTCLSFTDYCSLNSMLCNKAKSYTFYDSMFQMYVTECGVFTGENKQTKIGDLANLNLLKLYGKLLCNNDCDHDAIANYYAEGLVGPYMYSLAECVSIEFKELGNFVKRRKALIDMVLSLDGDDMSKISSDLYELLNSKGVYLTLNQIQDVIGGA